MWAIGEFRENKKDPAKENSYFHFRVIDVGSEWRTFSNEKASVDPSRVGGPENPLLSGGDLSTMIGPGTGSASFDAFGSRLKLAF